MGCANSKNSDEASNTPNPTGQQKRKVKRDSVVVTKARMAKQKGRPKEKAPSSMTVEVIE